MTLTCLASITCRFLNVCLQNTMNTWLIQGNMKSLNIWHINFSYSKGKSMQIEFLT